ncbi:MAG: hypothetical protein AAGI48_01545 [Verrucomicrobiota bacterium]
MSLRLVLAFLLSVAPAWADRWSEAFEIHRPSVPKEFDPQIGGMDFIDDGRIALCLHSGQLVIHDPSSDSWSVFAEGLQEPLGLVVENASSMVVMQRSELTRIRDTDGDGRGDDFQTLCDNFGLSGNYHEYAYGPARDKDGNFYIALNLASNGAGIAKEIRGEWHPTGLERKHMELEGKAWDPFRGRAGRMYARVPYRGWVLKVSKDGQKVQPFASGFRSPDGIGFDADGRLLVTDNQGDWRGTSPLYEVREGGFYGHPASLLWQEGWDRDPLKMPAEELNKLRTPEAAFFPHGELANSPTQPLAVPEGVFGPFSGQTLIGEMNQRTLIRFLPDPVGDGLQGTLLPFIQSSKLGRGNHRLAFAPDGSLWVGKTHLSWAGDKGLARIRLRDKEPFAIESVTQVKGGFRLRFSREVDPESIDGTQVERHRYHYYSRYGSPKVDPKKLELGELRLSGDGRELWISPKELAEGFVHTLILRSVRSKEGKILLGDVAYYNLLRKR